MAQAALAGDRRALLCHFSLSDETLTKDGIYVTDAMDDAVVSMEQVGGGRYGLLHGGLISRASIPHFILNGIGANIEALAPFADEMNERAFIMLDMPGVGESPDPLVPYNPFTISWTASELLKKLGVEEVDVMGISWGGGIAQHFSMQHPGLTRRVVLIATSAGMLMMPGSPKALSKMANPRRYIDTDFMMKNFETLYGEGLGKVAGKKGHMSRLKPPSPRGYMYQLLCMLGWTSSARITVLAQAKDPDHDGRR